MHAQALNKADVLKQKSIDKKSSAQTVPLLSAKNFLVIANIAEEELEDKAYQNNKHYQALVKQFGHRIVIPVSARVEYELTQMERCGSQEIMDMMGLASQFGYHHQKNI